MIADKLLVQLKVHYMMRKCCSKLRSLSDLLNEMCFLMFLGKLLKAQLMEESCSWC